MGIDIHPLKAGRRCILGGVELASDIGLDGHSDADVVIHALIDALLGAACLGDIGQWFPDTDQKYKNADSAVLLKEVLAAYRLKNLQVQHIDITVMAEKPRISPYAIAIRENLAALLQIDISAVSIKATTAEKMGFIGRGEGITALAIATVNEQKSLLAAQSDEFDYAKLPPQALAYLGDAVLEIHVRHYLLTKGVHRGAELQKLALQYVSATAQASMVDGIMPYLTESEQNIWRWGRNSGGGNVPKNTDVLSYRYSTGLETLLGYLYLSDQKQRLDEILRMLMAIKK